MSRYDLELRNNDGNTALYFAAASGDVEIAEMLIKKNPNLPNIPGGGGMTPIHMAALFHHGEMVKFLYVKTNFGELSDIHLINLFLSIISADIYDVALWMLNRRGMEKRILILSGNDKEETALHLMARKHSALSRKSLFQKFAHYGLAQGFFRADKMRTLAHQLVQELWKIVVELPREQLLDFLNSHSRLLFDAAKSGNVEFLVILIRSYPDLIWKVDDNNRSLFHVAALYRHESIFNIIYELGGIKDLIASYKEFRSNDNLLHLVARLPPSNRLQVVSGPALQMQRELLWFKAVEEMVPRSYIKQENGDGEVPHAVFTREHENLRKQGEKWMKETATACMLVATLIATVVFAAAFTIPGGNDNKKPGFPTFRKKLWFDVFIISDSVSLLSSVTSIVIFLSILTSRYAGHDFRTVLPLKLILGLTSLTVSIISMLLAFTATMILIRDHEPKWSLILILSLVSLATLSFLILHSRLWFETVQSTVNSKFLFNGRKRALFL